MNNEENNFEEFIKEQLETHTVEVSDSVWAGIEKKQKKREAFVWFKHYLNVFIALDIVFISSLSAFTVFNMNDVRSQNKLSQNEQRELKNDKKINLKNHPVALALALTDTESNENNNSTEELNKTATNHKAAQLPSTSQSTELNQESLNTQVGVSKNSIKSTQSATQSTKKNAAIEPAQQHPLANTATEFSAMPTNDNNLNQQQNKQAEITIVEPAAFVSTPEKELNAELKTTALAEKENSLTAIKNQEKQPEIIPTENALQEKTSKEDPAAAEHTSDDAAAKFDTVYSPKKFKGYVAIDALVSPEIAFRSFSTSTAEAQDFISKRDSAEGLRLSYSALMRVNLFINRNIFINTGISFAQQREKFSIEHKWITHEDYIDSSKFVTHVDPMLGNTIYKTYDTLDYVRSNAATISHDVVLTFVDMPVMIGYKWLGKRTGLALQGGVICNLIFKQKGNYAAYNYILNDVKTDTQNPYNTSAGLSLAGAITGNFKLNDQVDLLVEPHTRYFLKPISSSSYPVQQKIFSYGLNVGLRLKL